MGQMGTAAAPAAGLTTTKRGDSIAHAKRVVSALSAADARRVATMKRSGIVMPLRTLLAARKAKLPLSLACALLMQESGGGHNVFGHDPTIFAGAGEVTKEKYLAYRRQRGTTRMQGVGPVQLTWWELQDEADRRGGCWKPEINMLVGFERLAGLVRHGLRDGVRMYNGSGRAADAYAKSLLGKQAHFDALLREKPPAPAKVVVNPANAWKKSVYGDTDCHRDLLVRLAAVSKEVGQRVYVRSGNRTYGEQAVLYNHYLKYGKPLAAKPGTSNHEGGRAADCQVNGTNIGDYHGARDAMRRHGLCLPVPGEPWHVEVGTNWRA